MAEHRARTQALCDPQLLLKGPSDAEGGQLEAVGLEPTVLAEEVPQTMQLDRAEDLFELFATGTVRTRALLRAQTDDARRAIAARMAEEVRTAGLNLPCPASLSVAVKKS